MKQAPETAPVARSWSKRRDKKNALLAKASSFAKGRIIAPEKIVEALETLIQSSDRVAL
jgi:malonate decarboxylase alpha subunit